MINKILTLEIAKKLSEKGFNKSLDDILLENITIGEVVDWLWTTHNLWLIVDYYREGFSVSIVNNAGKAIYSDKLFATYFTTYEKAYLKAIDAILTDII